MKKASVIALCVLLAAALIFAFVLYRNYGEKERELALCEEEKNALNRKLGETAEETAAAEAELIEKANARISGLEQAMESTRQNYAGLEEALHKLRLEADERESAIEILEEALGVKETDLRDATQNFEATRTAMEKRVRECNRELSMVKANVSEFQVALEAGHGGSVFPG
jgi:chromosome segregation ATPase